MTKYELHYVINEILDITMKYDEMMKKARDVRYRYRDTYVKRSLLFIIILVYLWGTKYHSFSGDLILQSLCLTGIIGLPLYCLYRVWASWKRRESQKQSEDLKAKAKIYLEESLENAMLPKIYCETKILRKFLFYIEGHLAENLKDCANLYHSEKQYEKLHIEIEYIKWRLDQVPVTTRNLSNEKGESL
ncbi:hypothetical protein [Bacillus marasmi]|uniref:hypothetical protein n=1 Tax=Bacillus marasmi TaxID=1926279 RepID=UPI0011C8F5E0|nr:hypothetical protein [Bacillus marasmi]